MAKSRRRGRGALYKYETKAGIRWRWQLYAPSDPSDPESELARRSKGGFRTSGEADDDLRAALLSMKNQQRIGPARTPTVQAYASDWLDSLRLAPSTLAGYRRIVRLYIDPQIGSILLDRLTPTRVAKLYTELLRSGGQDGSPISANTVRKCHVILGTLFDAAIDDGHVMTNPVRRHRIVKAPTGKQVRSEAPEMVTWSATELKRFLAWDKDEYHDEHHAYWYLLAYTGLRRSEGLALRWGDVDIKNCRIAVRRAADTIEIGTVKATKSGGARVVDVEQSVIDVLKSWKALRGTLSLAFARADGYIFGDDQGRVINPNRATMRWSGRVAAARREQGDEFVPTISLHGLRHTHATLLLAAGIHPKVVQERLGHADISITMSVYSHVTETMQRDAVDRLAAILSGA